VSRFLLLTKGTHGDLMPFLGLGSALRARGHHVTLVTHAPYEPLAARARLDYIALDTAEEFERFVDDGALLNSPAGAVAFFRRHCLPRAPRELAILRRALGADGDAVLVSRHMASIADLLIAEEHTAPVVRLFTAVSQVTTFGLLPMLFRDVLASDLAAARLASGARAASAPDACLAACDLNIGNWPAWFAETEPAWPVAVTPVGFLQDDGAETGELAPEAEALLARTPRPVLITGGTGTSLGARFYAVAAEACQRIGRAALLVTRHAALVPDPRPDGVVWFPALPFASVMPRVAAVIHHGGAGTIARSIAAGARHLVLPHGADRPDNAARLSRLGVATALLAPQWRVPAVADALAALIASPTVGAACANLARRDRAERPCDAAADAAEHARRGTRRRLS
jgi:rhamnosyltransferase subunit B